MSEQPSPTTYDAGSLYAGFLDRLEPDAAAASHPGRDSLLAYGAAVYPGFVGARHHRAIAEALEAVERGEIDRLIIETPPRHGKSTLTSHLFPTWFLGRNPDKRVIACSYAADLAYDLSRKARNTLRSPDYAAIFPKVELAADARAVKQWELAHPHKGGYVAAGVGGPITGKGAHVLLIDDPIKSAEQAASATILDTIWEWYGATAYTRLEGRGAVVLIMTRWSDGDLTGRLLQKAAEDPDADQWHVVHLPALAEEDDALGREVDEALWPEKYSTKALRRIEKTIGSRSFAALYQQRPSKASGNIFKRDWWQRFPSFERSDARQIIQVWDTAFKAKETNDFSVCSTWALTRRGAYIVDVFRDRLEYPALKRKAQDLAAAWRPVAVLIEDKASGQSLIQDLQADTLLPVIPVPADSDKVVRANAVTSYVEAGRVFLPESAPWVDAWIEEHAAFPNGAYDDQVDTTAHALKRLFVDAHAFRDADIEEALDPTLALDEELFK